MALIYFYFAMLKGKNYLFFFFFFFFFLFFLFFFNVTFILKFVDAALNKSLGRTADFSAYQELPHADILALAEGVCKKI